MPRSGEVDWVELVVNFKLLENQLEKHLASFLL